MGLFATMCIFFILITMVFVSVAIFFPEVMGITGKKATEVIKDHQGGTEGPTTESSPKAKEPDSKT